MSTDQNKELVRKMIEAIFVQGDEAWIDELVSPNFVEHEQLPPGFPDGREGVKLLTVALHNAFPDFRVHIEDIIAEDDKVVIRMTWTGTQQGEFMGIPPTGNRISIGVFDILRIAGGQVVEHWGQMDNMGMMQQLGVISMP